MSDGMKIDISDEMKRRFQATVVRYAPDPSSGEMLNIGVVLICPERRFAQARFIESWRRVTATFPAADFVLLRKLTSALQGACQAAYDTPQMSSTDDVESFLSSVIPAQDGALLYSKPMSGITADPERTLSQLFVRFVPSVSEQGSSVRPRRDDEAVWQAVSKPLKERGLLNLLVARQLKGSHYDERFEHAWKNGQWNVAKPLSFDMSDPQSIKKKAANWAGRIRSLQPISQHTKVHLLVGLPPAEASAEIREAANHALALFHEELGSQGIATIVPESDGIALADQIERDLAHAAE